MLMRVENQLSDLGISWFSDYSLPRAAGGGVVLLINILFYDKGEK
jgi:hypothetical protein